MLKRVFRAAVVLCLFAGPAFAGANKVTLSAPGVSDPISIDGKKNLGVGVLVNVPNGVTFSGKVEVSGFFAGPWNDHDTLVNLTGSANGNIVVPVGAVRLNAATLSGGTVTLTVIQPDN